MTSYTVQMSSSSDDEDRVYTWADRVNAAVQRYVCGQKTYMCMQNTEELYNAIKMLQQQDFDSLTIERIIGVECDATYDEFVYLVYLEIPSLVSWDRVVMFGNPFRFVKQLSEMPEITHDPKTYVDMLLFFKNFDLTSCFTDNSVYTQKSRAELEKSRAKIWECLLVDVHQDSLSSYFEYQPEAASVWSCKGISPMKPAVEGEQLIAPADVARGNLHKFTFGLLESRPGGDNGTTFPWECVVLAGGSIMKILCLNYEAKYARQSDCDIWVIGENYDVRAKNLARVLEWFQSPKSYYAVVGSVTSIYIDGVARVFQIISTNNTNAYEVISRFDLSHVQWCYFRGSFYGTPDALQSMRSKTTRICNAARLKTTRIIKAMYCGYDVIKCDEMQNAIDITKLMEPVLVEGRATRSVHLQEMLRELHSYYYPNRTSEFDDLSDDEYTQHVLSMIAKYSKASVITNLMSTAIDNIIISGDFERGYDSIQYTTFRADTVVAPNRANIYRDKLRTKFGIIKLTTDFMPIVDIVIDKDITIKCKITDSFSTFIENVENNIFRMWCNQGVSRSIVCDGMITFHVPGYKLIDQSRRSISLMRNTRGAPMSIEDDLHVGDSIQIAFCINLNLYDPNSRSIDLVPMRVIKYGEASKYVELDFDDDEPVDSESKIAYVD